MEEFLEKGKKSIKQVGLINYFALASIVLTGVITAILQIIPPPGSGFFGIENPIPWNFQINFQKIEFILRALVNAYFPVPNFNLNFWSSNFFFQNISLRILGSILVLYLRFFCFSLYFVFTFTYGQLFVNFT